MKSDPISHYEDSNYPSIEEFMESYKKNKLLKGGAAVLAASLVGLSLTACEPPSDTDTDNEMQETSIIYPVEGIMDVVDGVIP